MGLTANTNAYGSQMKCRTDLKVHAVRVLFEPVATKLRLRIGSHVHTMVVTSSAGRTHTLTIDVNSSSIDSSKIDFLHTRAIGGTRS